MKNRLPLFLDKKKVCIICEGGEEYDYLKKLIELNVWNVRYMFYLDNAKGNGNIPPRYQDRYQNGSYDIVLIFCDTEKKPYEQYEDIKKKVDDFHGVKNISNEVVMYGNPCTMQIILQHWTAIKLKSPAKKTNASLIKELTGVADYKGKEKQREELMKLVTAENYQKMYERIQLLEDDDTIKGSSNFGRFLDYFTSDKEDWIEQINEKLEN